MADYPTKKAEAFAARALERFYATSVADKICNKDYEGEIKTTGSIVNVLTLDGMTIKTYSGTAMVADTLTESNCQLVTDQKKGYYFKVQDIEKLESYIKDPENSVIKEAGLKIKKAIDQYVLALWPDVGAGNRVGTDYTTGYVAVAATTGVVTGTGTTFTAAMVGKPFKCLGQTEWYRVKSFESTTQVTIEDDKDDVATAYTGGAITNPGTNTTTYVIQASTAVQVAYNTIYGYINDIAVALDDAEIPDEDRWIVVPPAIAALIRRAPEYIPALAQSYQDVVKRGLVGEIAGFTVYKSPRVVGNSVDGWHIMAGHTSGITLAMAMTEAKVELDLPGDFGCAPKGLTVFGAKVADVRRKSLGEGFFKL